VIRGSSRILAKTLELGGSREDFIKAVGLAENASMNGRKVIKTLKQASR
jgi:hypothetical protein